METPVEPTASDGMGTGAGGLDRAAGLPDRNVADARSARDLAGQAQDQDRRREGGSEQGSGKMRGMRVAGPFPIARGTGRAGRCG